jgi:parallel beta-helix repeat protein
MRTGERNLFRRTVSVIVLALLLTGMLAFNIKPVRASGTIYIRADGSIDPPTAPIQRDGDIYTFTADIYDSIVIERSNVAIDGAGLTLQGSGDYRIGFAIYKANAVTIRNTKIDNWWRGILLYPSSGNIIYENEITHTVVGIWGTNSSSNKISNNYIAGNQDGMYFYPSDNNIVSGSSDNNIVSSNIIEKCQRGILFVGSENDNTIFDNGIAEMDIGGIYLEGDNWFVSENTIVSCPWGLLALNISHSTISENRISGAVYDGLDLSGSGHNAIYRNDFTNCGQYGLCLESVDAEFNEIYENTISDNKKGGLNIVSSNNKVYHNNFTANTPQVSAWMATNVWDNGYPSGGNYWSDYTDVDLYSGPNQNELGSDGIWDHPYVIDANNQDHYPLVDPYGHATTGWTFAVITDLHIGRGYSNYNGESYYLTERLQTVVKWIIDNAAADNIRFVVVLGDITEDGTQAEMQKAKDILNGLGNMPYFPVIGNHDVQNGDSNFDSEFDDNFFNTQCGKLNVAWENGRSNEPGVQLQNYAFTYEDKMFVFLDFVDRVWPYAQALRYDSTLAWLQTQLQKGNPSFLFSHHPMIENRWVAFDDIGPIGDTITMAGNNKGTKVLASFAGHIHGYYDSDKLFSADYSFGSKTDALSHLGELIFSPVFFNANGDYQKEGFATPANIPVITTEAMMVGSNEPTEKGVIRLAKITGDKITTSEEAVFPSLNPYITSATTSIHLSGNDVDLKAYAFTKMFNTGHPIEYSLYVDGEFMDRKDSSAVEQITFKNQKLSQGTHEVNLTVVGHTPDGGQVIESIKRTVIVGKLFVHLRCPADIFVTDPAGRTISKQVSEIPDATYIEADLSEDGDLDKFVEILAPIDGNYVITLNGTDLGLYSMLAQFATSQEVVSFNATEIPVSSRTMHQFTINWTALSQGEEGVTIEVDSDGDGTPEYNFTSDSELSRIEYVAATTQRDIGITGMTSSKSVTGEGYTLPVNITTMNYGVYTETFNVTFYVNTTLAASQTVTLASGNFTTVAFTWNTTGFSYGKYTISAFAEPVLNETYVADNNVTGGTLKVTIAGDVNGDFTVDIYDAIILANAYSSKLGSQYWNPNADINSDNIVDIYDAIILANHYGTTS